MNLPIVDCTGHRLVAHLALRILALSAGMPVEDLVLLRQGYSRLAIKRTPRIVVYLPAGPAYVKHVFLAQGRILVENGNYCPLEESNGRSIIPSFGFNK